MHTGVNDDNAERPATLNADNAQGVPERDSRAFSCVSRVVCRRERKIRGCDRYNVYLNEVAPMAWACWRQIRPTVRSPAGGRIQCSLPFRLWGAGTFRKQLVRGGTESSAYASAGHDNFREILECRPRRRQKGSSRHT